MELKYTITQDGSVHLRERGITRTELATIEARFNASSYIEAGNYMCKTPQTVKFHMSSVFKKLGVTCLHGFLLYMIPYVAIVTTKTELEFQDVPEPELTLPKSSTAPLLS